MKKTSKFLTITLAILALGLATANVASAKDEAGFSVAVIDTQQIVAKAPQISSLNAEQRKKLGELDKAIQNAKADLAKQTDEAKRKDLEAKYTKELNAKKDTIEQDYAKKLAVIDKKINETIIAKSKGYNMVLAKGIVLKGGTDITGEVLKALK